MKGHLWLLRRPGTGSRREGGSEGQIRRSISLVLAVMGLLVFTGPGFTGRVLAEVSGQPALGPTVLEINDPRGPGTSTDDLFGSSVAISGPSIVVGAPGVAPGAGRAYVFRKAAGSWRRVAELKGLDPSENEFFGASVAISSDTIVVGGPDPGGGRAYVFEEKRGSWLPAGELTGTGTAAGDGFGSSVAISGATIVVGAPGQANQAGRAYVFNKGAAGWAQTTELKGLGMESGDEFGVTVAVSFRTVVVGAPAEAAAAGRAYVFS